MYIREIPKYSKDYYEGMIALLDTSKCNELWQFRQMMRRFMISIWVTQDLLKMYEENADLSNDKNYEHLVKGHINVLDLDWCKNVDWNRISPELKERYEYLLDADDIIKEYGTAYKDGYVLIIDWKYKTFDNANTITRGSSNCSKTRKKRYHSYKTTSR